MSFAETRLVKIGDGVHSLHVAPAANDAGSLTTTFLSDDGEPQESKTVSSKWWFGNPLWQGTIDGKEIAVQVKPILNGFQLSYAGVAVETHVYTQREAELVALMPYKEPPDTSKLLLCPMPGLVVDIHVAEGDQVKAGQSLCIVEAMKMENILKAERDGTVASIKAAPGDSLAVDEIIMEFE